MEPIQIKWASKNENVVPPLYSDVLDAASLYARNNKKLNFYEFDVENSAGFWKDFQNFVFPKLSKFEPIQKKTGASYKKTEGGSRGYHSMVYPEQKELER